MHRTGVATLVGAIVLVVVIGGWLVLRGTSSTDGASRMPAADRAADESRPAVVDAGDAKPLQPKTYDPATDQDAASATTAPTSRPRSVAIAGRVVDDRRRPVASALVEAALCDAGIRHGTTDADGRFSIELGEQDLGRPLHVDLHATSGQGVAWRSVWCEPRPPAPIDAGILPLFDGQTLVMRVRQDGACATLARVFIIDASQAASGTMGFGPLITGADGLTKPIGTPPGRFRITALSQDGNSRADLGIELPLAGTDPLDIELKPAWHLTVTVLDGLTEQPVPGLRLSVESSFSTGSRMTRMFAPTTADPIRPTDEAGRSMIRGLSPARPVTVMVVPKTPQDPWSEGFREGTRGVAKPGTESLVLRTPPGERFTFPIVDDETSGPPDGATLELSVPQGFASALPPEKAKVVGRDVVIERVPKGCINILATAADGSMAIVRILGDAGKSHVGSEARFKKPRTIHVWAHDRDGQPLAGYVASLPTAGTGRLSVGVTLDATGRGDLSNIYPRKTKVHVQPPDVDAFTTVGSSECDTSPPGDANVEIAVERERTCVLQTVIDGTSRIPASYSLRIPETVLGPIDENLDAASLTFKFRPSRAGLSLTLIASARGCEPAYVPIPPADGDTPTVLTAAFSRGATIRVRVLPPADGQYQLALQRAAESGSSWATNNWPARDDLDVPVQRAPIMTVPSLAPGRCRAKDMLTGLVSDPIEVGKGGEGEIALDLSHAGKVAGRVEGPQGDRGTPAVITVVGDGIDNPGDARRREGGKEVPLNADFDLRIPGDRPVTIRVQHPNLTPVPGSGSATMTAPGGSFVLKLTKGAVARLRVADATTTPPYSPATSRVRLFGGEPTGAPVATCEIRFENDQGAFTGFQPGRYTLWFDLRDRAPLVLRDLELKAEGTDLGELKPPAGATLRVKVETGGKPIPPLVFVTATLSGNNGYSRSAQSRKTDDVVVHGLGPGRFEVTVNIADYQLPPHRYEIESTGTGEVPLTVDWR